MVNGQVAADELARREGHKLTLAGGVSGVRPNHRIPLKLVLCCTFHRLSRCAGCFVSDCFHFIELCACEQTVMLPTALVA